MAGGAAGACPHLWLPGGDPGLGAEVFPEDVKSYGPRSGGGRGARASVSAGAEFGRKEYGIPTAGGRGGALCGLSLTTPIAPICGYLETPANRGRTVLKVSTGSEEITTGRESRIFAEEPPGRGEKGWGRLGSLPLGRAIGARGESG